MRQFQNRKRFHLLLGILSSFLVGILLSGCVTPSKTLQREKDSLPEVKSQPQVPMENTRSQETTALKSAPSQDTTLVSGDTTVQGSITLKWKTESEQENYGFNIYRSLSKEGPWVKITDQVVPGHGTTSEPHEYRFVDNGIFKFTQYYYQLEEIDLSGNAKRLPYTIRGMDKKPLQLETAQEKTPQP